MKNVREHLVVLPERALRRLLRARRPVLSWTRRRREPPVGAVARGDRIFFKSSGGPVRATTSVARIKETLKRGRYTVRLGLRHIEALPVPFPIVKRDRRSWVTCTPPPDHQQRLFVPSALTVSTLVASLQRRYRPLPSVTAIRQALHALLARTPTSSEADLVILLGLLLGLRQRTDLSALLEQRLRSSDDAIYPLAVFRPTRDRRTRQA